MIFTIGALLLKANHIPNGCSDNNKKNNCSTSSLLVTWVVGWSFAR
jgi:hypothetical protein